MVHPTPWVTPACCLWGGRTGSWGSTGTPVRSGFWARVWPEGPEDPVQGPVRTVGSRASVRPAGEGTAGDGKNTQNCTKKIFMTRIITMVWSPT